MNVVTKVYSNEDPWGWVAAPGRTKGEPRSNGDGLGGFMRHKKADQGDSGVTMWWTRRTRSTQAESLGIKVCTSTDRKGKCLRKRGPGGWRSMQGWTRRVRACARADPESKALHTRWPGGSRSGQGWIWVPGKCTGLHGRATGADGHKVEVHQRRTRESGSKEWWASNPTGHRWQSVSSH